MEVADNTSQALVPFLLDQDPYLSYKPDFAYSYATQLALNGIIFTLLFVLAIHLLFTAQHHYPLARLNFLLQFSGLLITLAAVVATLAVILKVGEMESSIWPYMNDYIYVDVPIRSWSLASLISWYTMEALSSGIVQITHIQFLTLLYPSALEARLIFGLLGPMALASSAMTFTALSPSASVVRNGLIVRNICNSTLTLLFTSALFIWGFIINRKRAWRTDGGTAAFGAGALGLAVSGTAANFVEVKVDKLSWLQHLLSAIILWQMWLGWWWWVGSGMGIGEVEDMLEKEHRKTRKAEQRRKRKENRKGPGGGGLTRRLSFSTAIFTSGDQTSTSSVRSAWEGALNGLTTSVHRRRTRRERDAQPDQESIEMDRIDRASHEEDEDELDRPDNGFMRTIPDDERERNITLPEPVTASPSSLTDRANRWTGRRPPAGSPTTTSGPNSSSSNSSTASPSSLQLPDSLFTTLTFPLTVANYCISRLGRAHAEAAKQRVVERTARRGRGTRKGWGLGYFGVQEARDGTGRIEEAQREAREGRLLGDPPPDSDDAEWVDEQVVVVQPTTNARRIPPARRQSDKRPELGWSWGGPLKKWRLKDKAVY